MAQPSPNNPTGRTPGPDVPAIRTFQLDRGDPSAPEAGVNLFRGTVTFPLQLLTLSGRGGLDLDVSATYEGNIGAAVDTWNVERPTGTMGLGWTSPFEAIVIDDGDSADTTDNRYYLVSGSRGTPLIFDGGRDRRGWLTCQTQPHAFWSVAYDPRSQTWEIVHTDGTTYRYGGPQPDQHTVQWGVCWGPWTGPSSQPAGQRRYPIAWNLSEIESTGGDKIVYSYDSVEQNVGAPGPEYARYTKASYLSTITDMFGRRVTFDYADKTFDLAGGICEYQDPHRDLTSAAEATEPDAYQSRYETRYLERLRVTGPDGRPLLSVRLTYQVQNLSDLPTSDPRHPFLAKRYLVGVTQQNPAGEALPGYRFDYCGRTTSSGETEPFPGALAGVTYPGGGRAAYRYEQQRIEPAGGGDPRYPLRTVVSCPEGLDAAPRVWHGPDYTVITWHDRARRVLSLSTYRWLGRWTEYRSPSSYPADIVDSSLRVECQEDFFCLTWTDGTTASQQTRLFRGDPEKFGSWVETDAGERLTSPTQATQVAAGGDFVLFASPHHSTGGYLWGRRWEWRTRSWQPMSPLPSLPVADTPRLVLAAGRDSYIAGSYVPGTGGGPGTLTLARGRQDPTMPVAGGWQTPQTISSPLTVYDADRPDQDLYLLLSLSSTAVAATYVTGLDHGSTPTIRYAIRVFNWRLDGRFAPDPFTHDYTCPVPDEHQVAPVLATFSAGPMYGNLGNLLRYTGGDDSAPARNWASWDSPSSPGSSRFAYGPDAALTATDRRNLLVTFDPARPSSAGFSSQNLADSAGTPSISGGYLNRGPDLYGNAARDDWTRLPETLPGGDFDTTLNAGPGYLLYDQAGGQGVRVAHLRNGGLDGTEQLNDTPQTITTGIAPGPGTTLIGPASFVTLPSGDTLDTTRTLMLYRVVDHTCTGPIYATPVVAATMSDPDDLTPAVERSFEYDQTTVVYDPANAMTRYSKVTAAAARTARPSGRTVLYFSNGVATDSRPFVPVGSPVNYHQLLTGQLLRQETYSPGGTLQAASTLQYSVRQTASRTPDEAPSYVVGAWMSLSRKDDLLDGVRRWSAMRYSSFSGLRTRTETADYDGTGREVTLRTDTTYAYDVADYRAWALRLHLLEAPVQVTHRTGEDITAAGATTWSQWPGPHEEARWAASGQYQWTGTGAADFDFASPTTPTGWLRVSRIITRDPVGLMATEQSDVDGVPTSIVYDARGMNPAATFAGASVRGQEAAYYGFEQAERNPGWAIDPAGSLDIVHDNAHTGTSCLRLPANRPDSWAQLRRAPERSDVPYVFGGWVRTAADYDEGAVWRALVLDPDGTVVHTVTHDIPATANQWQQILLRFDLPAGHAGRLTVLLQVGNESSADIFADNLRFSPLEAQVTAQVFDPSGTVQVAELGTRGEVQRFLTDRFLRARASTDVTGRPAWAGDQAAYRSGATGTARVTVNPAGAGQWVDLRNSDLSGTWHLPEPDSWWVDVATQTLHHRASASPQRLSMLPGPGAGIDGVQVEVRPGARPQHPIGVTVGSAGIEWSPDGRWVLRDAAGREVAQAPQPVLGTADWLLVGAGRTVLFFCDGRPVLQADLPEEVRGGCALTAQDDTAFGPLVAFSNAGIGTAFQDGFGRAVQQHIYGEGWTANAILFDDTGSQVATTKPAPLPQGWFGYWPGLVTARHLDADGTLEGGVSEYYSATGAGPSDDHGYPFTRQVYENCALHRAIELGQPGRQLAVDPSIPAEQHHTTRTGYGANPQIGTLPAGTCYRRTVQDPDGNLTAEVTNSRGQTLLRLAYTSPEQPPLTTRFSYNPSGKLERVDWASDGSTAQPVGPNTFGYDFLGRQTSQTTPDLGDGSVAGTTRTMYDDAGRIRFRQTPTLAAAGRIGYLMYDAVGRLREEGLVAFDWTPETAAALQQHANDRAWPGTAGSWRRRHSYGTDPGRPADLLRLTGSLSRGSDDAPPVETRFAYDLEGRVTSRGLRAAQFDDQLRTTSFDYDGLDRVRRIRHTGGGHEFEARYDVNRIGLITAISTGTAGRQLAGFCYNADSTLQQLRFGTSTPVVQNYGYSSPSWVTGARADALDEQVYYTQDSDGRPGRFDGSPVQIRTTQVTGPRTTDRDLRAGYDALARLTDVSLSQAGAVTRQAFGYDALGNLLTVTGDGQGERYRYQAGTNRVCSVEGTDAAYTYDADGNIVTAPGGRSFGYDPMTGLPAHAQSAQTRVSYAYDARGARVLEDADGRMTLSVPGLDETVLSTWESGEASFHVYGPTGLLASVSAAGARYYLKHHLGSTRAVLGADGRVVAAYEYDAWGRPTCLTGSLGDAPFLYAGYSYDPQLGLYFCRVRFYDPALRRFYGMDPASEFANPYLYVANSPLRYLDPTGRLAALLIALLIGVVVGAIGGLIAGVTTSIKDKLPVGESIWRTILFTLVGAATGALTAGAAFGAAAAAPVVAGSAGAAFGETAGAVAGVATRVGIMTVASTGIGAVSGSANAAIGKGDPALGAETGALVGFTTGIFGAFFAEGITATRAVTSSTLGQAARTTASDVGDEAITTWTRTYSHTALLRGAVIQVGGGAAKGAVSGVISTAVQSVRGRDDWNQLHHNVLLGAIMGALWSVSAPVQYFQYAGRSQVVLAPSAAIGDADL